MEIALRGVVLLAVLLGGCEPLTPIQPTSTLEFSRAEFTFRYPTTWHTEAQAADVQELLALYDTTHPSFKLAVIRKRPAAGASVQRDLCAVQESLQQALAPGISPVKKEIQLDGEPCCASVLQTGRLEATVLSVLVEGYLYILYYQLPAGRSGDALRLQAEDVLRSWHWQHTEPTPSPSASAPSLDDRDYFPLADGAEWDYDVLLNNDPIGSMVMTAHDVQATGEALYLTTSAALERRWTFDRPLSGRPTSERFGYEKTLTGVTLTPSDGEPHRVLLTLGDTWVDHGATLTVEARDVVVETPLGDMEGGLRILETRADGTRVRTWYTEFLGPVQSVEIAPGGQHFSYVLTGYDFGELPL